METINIDLLRETSIELRKIKDGKGGLSLGGRIEAAKALKKIHSLVLTLEESKKGC